MTGYFVFYHNTKNEKLPVFFHISLLGSDQKYEMEKRAPGQNLILIFNWSGLHDLEVWPGCSALEAASDIYIDAASTVEGHA